MARVFARYLLLQMPGWLLAAAVLWGIHQWAQLPSRVALVLFAAWVLKDILLYPVMRRFYVADPAAHRLVAERGTAVTALTPDGFVRVHGELWQARSDRPVEEGAKVRVREREGLLLLVSPE